VELAELCAILLFISLPFPLKTKEKGVLHHHAVGVCVLVSDSGIAEQF
jgi:hypothetical protein